MYAQLAELQYQQIQKLPTFIQENKKELESFGLLYFINQKNQLERSYPSGFFNGQGPEETPISLRDLKLSPAEIAKTWAMTK